MNFKTNLNQIVFDEKNNIYNIYTGKSFSEVLILASTNPKYDKRLSFELPVQNMKIQSLEHGKNMRRTCCAQKMFFDFVLTFRTICVHNMF